ncbi:type I-E CRISPR-associated protein Cse2/CasB, partial [bacterium]|nr:type I-E CRISPR-associated protein Cse2/CasB [bacterium]
MTAPTSAPASSSQQWDLVGRLQRLAIPEREDRAALAALRRSLGKEPGYSADVARIVQPALKDDAPPAEAEAYYLVASLFGLLPRHCDTPRDPSPPWAQQGLGWSLRRARLRDDGEADPGVERRFVALLDSRPDALGEHLRHLIKLTMSRDDCFALDYRKLLRDILDWDH